MQPLTVPEFTKMSVNQAYTLLNRDADISGNDLVDLNRNVLYSYRLYEDFTLRESTDTTIIHTDPILIDEGYVIYNIDDHSISFTNIHRVDGDLYTYQIKYIFKIIDDQPIFIPYIVTYSGDKALEITMKLDEDGNIIQVYNDSVPMVDRSIKELGVCSLRSSSPPSHHSGQRLIGSKDIDVMTGLTYILSHEITLLRRVGDLLVSQGLIEQYSIN